MSELTETLEEVESAIRRYSEELIQALALRDELDYEKEVLTFYRVEECCVHMAEGCNNVMVFSILNITVKIIMQAAKKPLITKGTPICASRTE